jgi:hypothetical protein
MMVALQVLWVSYTPGDRITFREYFYIFSVYSSLRLALLRHFSVLSQPHLALRTSTGTFSCLHII